MQLGHQIGKGRLRLTEDERKRLLKAYRSGEDVRVARRAHVLLLLAEGVTWEEIRRMLFASNDLIAQVRKTHEVDGVLVDGVLGDAAARTSRSPPWWLGWIQRWVTQNTPRRLLAD